MIKRSVFFILFAFIGYQEICAQSFLKTEGTAITNEQGDTVLLRGMGLGGWMLQEGYMLQTEGFAGAQWQLRERIVELIGEQETQNFYDTWLANNVTKNDIDSMKTWGFNSVRLPLHYNLFTLSIQEEPIPGQNTWINRGFELTDLLIEWCAQNEMYVVLDLHAAPGGQGANEGISDYNPAFPSLWESQENRDKTVALWRRIADYYKDEPVVAAYDLLNEPNWNLPGGILLRELYEDVTEAIREVDDQHIIIIEGNWFANDFTGLFPLWDDNIVLGPHKYWSFNNPTDNQWLIDLRDNNNVPIYLGESGENSNVWYRDAIQLLEREGFSWAWWTHKKVESISGLMSIQKSPKYQFLLNYWNGNGAQPSVQDAIDGLNELAINSNINNCKTHPDVVDAMFRQTQSDETLPFIYQNIPGIVYATDYDFGTNGHAYSDLIDATYHVATGNFNAWNNGWQYRNDGVDIEACMDNINTNGFNVGWLDEGEWMKYTVDVLEEGLYNVNVRVAGGANGGEFSLSANGSELTRSYFVPNTGGFQNWQSVIVEDIVLSPDDTYITFKNLGSGYNLNSFQFLKVGESSDVETVFTSACTLNKNQIIVHLSKPLDPNIDSTLDDFSISIDGQDYVASAIGLDPNNARAIIIDTEENMSFDQDILVSFSGNGISAADGTSLLAYTNEEVKNDLPFFHQIPGKIEAEDFFFQSGIQLEECADLGGGQNIGFLDPGDHLDYRVRIEFAKIYNIEFRTAAQNNTGSVDLSLINDAGDEIPLHQASFEPTGGWQDWASYSSNTQIPSGEYILRMTITGSQFNINWINFNSLTSTSEIEKELSFEIYPNPSTDEINILHNYRREDEVSLELRDFNGRLLKNQKLEFNTVLNLSNLDNGIYILILRDQYNRQAQRRLVKL